MDISYYFICYFNYIYVYIYISYFTLERFVIEYTSL